MHIESCFSLLPRGEYFYFSHLGLLDFSSCARIVLVKVLKQLVKNIHDLSPIGEYGRTPVEKIFPWVVQKYSFRNRYSLLEVGERFANLTFNNRKRFLGRVLL